MDRSLHLLTLPPEIRDQIWTHVFKDLHVDPFKGACSFDTECSACCLMDRPRLTSHATAVAPLLTCKQIHNEARELYYNNLTIHISSYTALSTMHITMNKNEALNALLRKLTLYTHLESENRFEWFAELFALQKIFPTLEKITIHNHMRPPKNYDCLIDAAYLLGPLIHLPQQVRPSDDRAKVPLTAQKATPSHDESATGTTDHPLPVYASRDGNPNFEIFFKYHVSEILFDSPFIGAISTDDAIEEHEAVLRDCLADPEFRAMATHRDLNVMTMALLDIAREHEQVWLEGLHRRRMGSDYIHAELMGEVDGGGEWGVDPGASDMSDNGSPLSHAL